METGILKGLYRGDMGDKKRGYLGDKGKIKGKYYMGLGLRILDKKLKTTI